jgi:nucleotide-binding universal stress UspA family protein
MGTHGRRGFQHLMLGSVAEQTVRRSSGPVLLIPLPKAT